MHFDFVLVGHYLNAGEIFLYTNLAKVLKNRGYSVAVITASNENEHGLEKNGIDVINFYEWIRNIKLSRSEIPNKAAYYEDKYELYSLRDFVFPERMYDGVDENLLINRAIRTFIFAEQFLDKHTVGCFVNTQGAEIIRRCLFHVGKARGIPSIYFGGGPAHFCGKMLLHSDEMNRLEDFNYTPYEKMTSKERKWIANYIEKIKGEKEVISYSSLLARFLDKNIVGRKIKRLIKWGKYGDWWRLRAALKYNLRSLIRYTRKAVSSIYYSKDNPSDRYIFFPFHVINDSQITLRNPQFYHQEYLVEIIARSLPQGYKLVAKPHPGIEGYLPLDKLRFLRKIENLVLLDPGINPYDVIRGARAIVIINSTVGFEALLYYKPVIVLGNWTLRGLGITIDVDNLFDLRAAIKEALKTKEVDKEKVHAVIFSLWKSMYEGSLNTPEPDFETIAESLIKKYKEISKTYGDK